MPREAGDKEGSFLSPAPISLLGCKSVQATQPGEGNSHTAAPDILGLAFGLCFPFSALKMLPSPKHPHAPSYSAQQSKLNASIFSSYSCVPSPCSGVSCSLQKNGSILISVFELECSVRPMCLVLPMVLPSPLPSLSGTGQGLPPLLGPVRLQAPWRLLFPHSLSSVSLSCPVCFPQPLSCRSS